MKFTYSESVAMETYACCNCGMLFSMTADFVQRRRQNHDSFYCPQGHGQVFSGDSEKEKLQREVNRLKQDAARLEDLTIAAQRRANTAEEEARRARKEKARIEKRIHAGICPDCNRSFVNVARHMTTKHGLKCDEPPKLALVKS